jgi:biopolymer transport protein TolR
MAFGGSGGDRSMMSEINVTPLVDVMLVLLIVFMVTAPMMQTGVDVQLPAAGTAPLDKGDDAVTISVDRDGQIHMGSASMSMEEFRTRAPVILREVRGRPVYIRGDARISYGTIISAMAVLKGAGIERVGLVTQPEVD